MEAFTDIRSLQKQLKAQGVVFASEADEIYNRPASFMIHDPDGNPILVDQHIRIRIGQSLLRTCT